MALWGLYETQAEKELKKLKAEVAAKAIAEAEAAQKPVTLQDVRAVALEYGKQILSEAKEVGSELLAKAESKTAELKNTVVEKFNEQSGKVVVSLAETAFTVSKKAMALKKLAEKKLKK